MSANNKTLSMRSGFLTAGFLFLINPTVFTVDLFPDLVGLFLIYHGLFRLSLLEDHLEKARKYVRYLMLFSGLKFLLSFMLYSSAIETNRLLAAFVSAVGEWILYPVLIRHLFDGLDSLGIRCDGKGVFRGMDVCRVILTVFFIVRAALELAPNAVVLFYSEVDADPSVAGGVGFVRAEYFSVRNWALILSAVATLIFGIYAAFIVFRYRASVRSDKTFCDNLAALYRTRILENETASRRIALTRATTCFLLAPVFLVPFYYEDLPIIPCAFFFLFTLFGLKAVKRDLSVPVWQKAVLWSGAAVSLVQYGYRFYLSAAAYDYDAAFLTDPVCLALNIAQSAWIVLGALILYTGFARLVRKTFPYLSPVRCYFSLGLADALTGIGFYYEFFAPWNGIFAFLRWAFVLILIYLQKRSVDVFREEIDRKLI